MDYPYFIWKSLISLDKHIMVNKLPDFERPTANIEKIEIPGRDGYLTQDDGTYQGIIKTCECSLDNGSIDDIVVGRSCSFSEIFPHHATSGSKAI